MKNSWMLILAALLGLAVNAQAKQIVVYDQGTGGIVEVCEEGSDVSRFAGSHGILVGQHGVDREKNKVVAGKVQAKDAAALASEKQVKEAKDLESEMAYLQAQVAVLETVGADKADVDKVKQELADKQALWASKKNKEGGNATK